jgi:hypothetical protein
MRATLVAMPFLTRQDGNTMPTRKKNAAQPRQGKCKSCGETPPAQSSNIELMLMIGSEQVVIHSEEDDNIDFMAELIDP